MIQRSPETPTSGPQAGPPAWAGATPRATSGIPIPIPAPGVCSRPTDSPATAATIDPNPDLKQSRYPPVCVSAYPSRPAHSLWTPTAQDYEDSPMPTAAASPHDSTARSYAHAHAHAQGHGPARGPWWQRWTHKRLWELQK